MITYFTGTFKEFPLKTAQQGPILFSISHWFHSLISHCYQIISGLRLMRNWPEMQSCARTTVNNFTFVNSGVWKKIIFTTVEIQAQFYKCKPTHLQRREFSVLWQRHISYTHYQPPTLRVRFLYLKSTAPHATALLFCSLCKFKIVFPLLSYCFHLLFPGKTGKCCLDKCNNSKHKILNTTES